MTNKHDGNTVQICSQGSAGKLRLIQEVATQGLGTGATRDPLASQGAISLSEDGKLLFAVNPTGAELTAFQVTPSGLSFESNTSTFGLPFVVNTLTGTNSSYAVGQDRTLSLSGPVTANTGSAIAPTDLKSTARRLA